MVVVVRAGNGDLGSGCVFFSSRDWVRKGFMCRLVKINIV